MGKWLLDENVRSGPDRRNCLLNVKNRGGADQDEVGFEVVQRRFIIVEVFPGKFVAALFQPGWVWIAKTKISYPQKLQVSCVTPSDGTATNDQGAVLCIVGRFG